LKVTQIVDFNPLTHGGFTMSWRNMLGTAMLVMGVSMVVPTSARAQCGENCASLLCGWFRYTGYNEGPGQWAMTCVDDFCDWCESPLVKDGVPEAEKVLEIVKSAQLDDVASVLNNYRNRLFLYPSRNMLVFRGTDCATDAIASVVFLREERSRDLQRMGVLPLEIASQTVNEVGLAGEGGVQ
jgi:hypothetical protein